MTIIVCVDLAWSGKNEVNSELNIARPDENKIICDKNKSMLNCERAIERERVGKRGLAIFSSEMLIKMSSLDASQSTKDFQSDSVECERVEQGNIKKYFTFLLRYTMRTT